MWDCWVGKKVDLKLLSEYVRKFFEEKKFRSLVEAKSKEEYNVVAVPNRDSSSPHILENVNVLIKGEPSDFKIEFVSGSSSRFFTKLGGLTPLFGGGILQLRGLKSSEELEKLEREFWKFVEETVDHLDGLQPGT